MKMQRFWVGRALLLAVAVLYAGGYVRAQEAKDTLTLTLDRALEIALSDNPTIKVAEEEIALKKVTHKETWQNLLPQASIDGTWNHTISAAQMNLGGQSFKMGMDNSNTVSGVLNISLPIFAPSVYKAMSMTKTDIELAVEKSRASKLDLVNQVTKGYYQLMLTQDSYDVLQKSYKLAEDNYNIVNAKYQQGAVSEFDKISAEVQMRSIKPNVISAGNAVTLSKLQLKVLMGVTADVDIEIADNLGNYETELFANELNQPAANLNSFLCLHHILAVADNLLGTGSHVVLVAGNLHVQLSLCVQTVLLQLTYLNTVGLELGEIACLIQRNTQRKHQCGTSAPIIIEDVPILVVE